MQPRGLVLTPDADVDRAVPPVVDRDEPQLVPREVEDVLRLPPIVRVGDVDLRHVRSSGPGRDGEVEVEGAERVADAGRAGVADNYHD